MSALNKIKYGIISENNVDFREQSIIIDETDHLSIPLFDDKSDAEREAKLRSEQEEIAVYVFEINKVFIPTIEVSIKEERLEKSIKNKTNK